MTQSVCIFPLGTEPLVLGNILRYRIPKISPSCCPRVFFFPTRSLKIQYHVGTSSALKHPATAEANIVWLHRQAQEFKAKSQLPSHKTEVLERNQMTGRAVLHWFPGDSKPHRAHGKIIQSQAKCCNWGVSQQTCVVFHLIFSWKITGDFSISFQKKPQKPCFIQISAFELCRDFYSKCQVTFSIRNIEDWVLNERRPLPPEKCSFFSSVFSGPPENYQWQ